MHHLVHAAALAQATDNRAFKLEDHPVFCLSSVVVFGVIVVALLFKGRGSKSGS